MKKLCLIAVVGFAALAFANGENYFGREQDGNQTGTVKCHIYLNTKDSVLTGSAVTLSYGSLYWQCGYDILQNTGKFKVVVYNTTGTDTGAWYCVDSSGLITRVEDKTLQWDSAAFSGYTTNADSTYSVGFAVNSSMNAVWCYDDVVAVRRQPVTAASVHKTVNCTGTEPLIITPLNDSIAAEGWQWCVKASYAPAISSQIMIIGSVDKSGEIENDQTGRNQSQHYAQVRTRRGSGNDTEAERTVRDGSELYGVRR